MASLGSLGCQRPTFSLSDGLGVVYVHSAWSFVPHLCGPSYHLIAAWPLNAGMPSSTRVSPIGAGAAGGGAGGAAGGGVASAGGGGGAGGGASAGGGAGGAGAAGGGGTGAGGGASAGAG